jgi:hypothetical protein
MPFTWNCRDLLLRDHLRENVSHMFHIDAAPFGPVISPWKRLVLPLGRDDAMR